MRDEVCELLGLRRDILLGVLECAPLGKKVISFVLENWYICLFAFWRCDVFWEYMSSSLSIRMFLLFIDSNLSPTFILLFLTISLNAAPAALKLSAPFYIIFSLIDQ